MDTGATDATYDISNADRLGFSEVELVQKVVDGVKLLIEIEKALQEGLTIDNLLPGRGKTPKHANIPEPPSSSYHPSSPEHLSFPDLTKHNNHMAKCLTPSIYANLASLKTCLLYTSDAADE